MKAITEQGRKLPKATPDRHGMIGTLLKALGVPSKVAVEDAWAIEHNISPETDCTGKQLLNERRVSL